MTNVLQVAREVTWAWSAFSKQQKTLNERCVAAFGVIKLQHSALRQFALGQVQEALCGVAARRYAQYGDSVDGRGLPRSPCKEGHGTSPGFANLSFALAPIQSRLVQSARSPWPRFLVLFVQERIDAASISKVFKEWQLWMRRRIRQDQGVVALIRKKELAIINFVLDTMALNRETTMIQV